MHIKKLHEALRIGIATIDSTHINSPSDGIETTLSAAFLGILMSLTVTGILDLSHALPLVLGANLGSCSLPFIISLKSTDRGRQVSTAHVLLKVAGVIICFPLLSPFFDLVSLTSMVPARQIANAHFLFNLRIYIIIYILNN